MIEILMIVKVSAVIATTAVALAVTGRNASAASRHLLCMLAIAGLLTLPVLSLVLPAWSPIQWPASSTVTERFGVDEEAFSVTGPAAAFAPRATAPKKARRDDVTGPARAGHYVLASRALWLTVYACGVLLLTVRLLIDRLRVRRLARHATEVIDRAWQTLFRECADELGVRGHVRLLRSGERATPMAIGIRQPAIVVPAVADAWSSEMRRAVLLHELAHVARRDCLTQTAAAAPRQLEARMLALLDRARIRTLPTRFGRVAAISIFTAVIAPIAAASVGVQSGVSTPQAETRPTHDIRSDSLRGIMRRFVSVDYWRVTATEQLSRLATQLNYLSEMRQLGYSVADVNVLFRLRQHGVTPEFVRSLAAEGLSGLSTDDLLTAISHGISAGYVRDLKGLGYQPLDVETLTRLRSHGIDGDFIRELSSLGYQHLSIDDLTRLRSHGVDPEYIREMKILGYTDLAPEAFAELRSHGATAARIRSANERAGTRLSVDKLSELASHGWKQ